MNRMKEIDMMKGIAVLNVVAIHLWTNVIDDFEVANIIGFTLPAFFLISGYFLKYKPDEKEFFRRIGNILKPFLKYFLAIVILCGTVLCLKQESTWIELFRVSISELLGKDLLDWIAPGFYFRNGLHRALTVTWFFVQLLLATTMSFIILNLCKGKLNRVKMAIIVCVVFSMLGYFLVGHLPLQMQLTFAETAFMLIGYCIKEDALVEKIKNVSTTNKIMGIIIGICIVYILNKWNPGITFLSHGTMGSKGAVDVLTALCVVLIGSMSLYFICEYLCKIKIVETIVGYVGENSLDYVMLHMPIAWLAYHFFNIPIPLDYVRQASYQSNLYNSICMFGIFVVNLCICTIWIVLKKKLVKKING